MTENTNPSRTYLVAEVIDPATGRRGYAGRYTFDGPIEVMDSPQQGSLVDDLDDARRFLATSGLELLGTVEA